MGGRDRQSEHVSGGNGAHRDQFRGRALPVGEMGPADLFPDSHDDAFPADLSGGQKQLVAIARALAGDPGIILADEPTASLDSHTGRNVMQQMSELAHQRDRAVVIVTHDSRVLDFADRIVRIEDGVIAGASSHLRAQMSAGLPVQNLPIHSMTAVSFEAAI